MLCSLEANCGERGREPIVYTNHHYPPLPRSLAPPPPKFHVYVIYKVDEGEGGEGGERGGESKEGGEAPVAAARRLHVAGFMTTYRFTNPVRKERPVTRSICQALILPPFQQMGLGGRLLEVR